MQSLHAQSRANAKICHCSNTKGANHSRSLSKIRLLSAGACFPKVVLKHILSHPDTVVFHAQLLVSDGYVNSALTNGNILRCATHEYRVIRILHVLAQEGLR